MGSPFADVAGSEFYENSERSVGTLDRRIVTQCLGRFVRMVVRGGLFRIELILKPLGGWVAGLN